MTTWNGRALLLGLIICALSPRAFAGPQQHPESTITAQAPKMDPKVAPPAKVPTDTNLKVGETLDLNTATELDFQRIPGIGEGLAAAIVQHRDEIGGYQREDQLMDVAGIAGKRYARFSTYLVVNEDTWQTFNKAWQKNNTPR